MKSFDITEYKKPLQENKHELPVPTGKQVLLKVNAAGVCHSDLHIWEGGYDLGDGKFLSLKDRGATLPHTLGHETAGTIVSKGEDANDVEIGKTYLVYPWIGCGECATCQSGYENMCAKSRPLGVLEPGGFAEYILVPKAKYLIDLKELDPAIAAPYACSGLTTYSALKKLGQNIYDDYVIIIGAGGLGLMCISILKAMGGKGAIVVDIDEDKRQEALRNGAVLAVDGRATDVTEQILSFAGSAPPSVIDLVGSPDTVKLGFDILPKGGKQVIVGLFGGAVTLPVALIAVRGVSILGNLVGNLSELRELMELVTAGKVSLIPISKRPLEHANDALEELRDGTVVGRIVLVPEEI